MELFVLINFYQIIGIINAWKVLAFLLLAGIAPSELQASLFSYYQPAPEESFAKEKRIKIYGVLL
jgi:hypothetical protein